MENGKDYRAVLRQGGLKYTKHRALILSVLGESSQPIGAGEIFLRLQTAGAGTNLSTVYRTLEMLASKGLVIKTNIASDTKTLFELNTMEHKHHLICIGCKKMLSVDGCPIEEYEEQLGKREGFDVTGHKLEIYGFCQKCKAERK